MPEEAKPKQQRRRREPEAPDEQEVREGTRRGLKRHAEEPQQGDEGDPTTHTTRSWDQDESGAMK